MDGWMDGWMHNEQSCMCAVEPAFFKPAAHCVYVNEALGGIILR